MPKIEDVVTAQQALIDKLKRENQDYANEQDYLNKLQALAEFLKRAGFSDINDYLEKIECTPLLVLVKTMPAPKEENKEEIAKRLAMIDTLLSIPGLDIDKGDAHGRSPAWWAADDGQVVLLERFWKKGANLEKPDKDGKTPLFAAVKNKFFKAAAFILHKVTGYSIYEKETYGSHPIHQVCKKSSEKQAQNEAVLAKLHDNGVNINQRDANGKTPLHVAAETGNLQTIQWLIRHGADPAILDRDNDTFFEYLKPDKQVKLKDFLREHGISTTWRQDVNKVKEFGHVLGIGSFMKLGQKLGLGGIVQVPMTKGRTVPVYTERWDSLSSYITITEDLKGHLGDNPNDEALAAIRKAYQKTAFNISAIKERVNLHKYTDKISADYNDDKPVVFSAGRPGHGVGLAIYKDKLIYTDRFYTSGKEAHECTKIYQLNSTSPATMQILFNYLYMGCDSQKQLESFLNKVCDLESPILQTGDKMQSHGTCSYSNPRSNIEGLLCVLRADQGNNSKQVDPEAIIAQKEPARQAYKGFLYGSRKRKASELSDCLNQAFVAGDSAKADMYYDVIVNYLKGHRSKTKNDGTDWEMAKSLYSKMPEEYKTRLAKENSSLARPLQEGGKRTSRRILSPFKDVFRHEKPPEVAVATPESAPKPPPGLDVPSAIRAPAKEAGSKLDNVMSELKSELKKRQGRSR